jgi:lysophospholipase L1-like esterase
VAPRPGRAFRLAAAGLFVAGLCSLGGGARAAAQDVGYYLGNSPAVRYVALGDSYASGVGAGGYDPASGLCFRSANAYPALWAAAHQPASFTFAACSGATTGTVQASQLSAVSSATTLVSITVGGNDVGFSTVLETCLLSATARCVSAVTAAEGEIAGVLPGELDGVLQAIASAAPAARVVVLGYPDLYDLSRSIGCFGLSNTDRADLNHAADQLDSQLQAAAARHRDVFADVRPAFAGHQLCDSASWLHALSFPDLGDSYHPTAAGQSGAYNPALSAAAGWP